MMLLATLGQELSKAIQVSRKTVSNTRGPSRPVF